MGMHREAEFSRNHSPAFMRGKAPETWLTVYPFVRSYEWYLLPEAERRQMLAEHGKQGAEHRAVLTNTVASFCARRLRVDPRARGPRARPPRRPHARPALHRGPPPRARRGPVLSRADASPPPRSSRSCRDRHQQHHERAARRAPPPPPRPTGPEHVTEPTDYDAILLAGFGGPEGQDDVIPFLRNVTRGRGIPEERLEEVAHHYRHFGGVSPINEHNRELKAALEAELAARGIDLPVIWGNRNWDPYLADAVREATTAASRKLIAIATSAYSSYSSCRQYREDFAMALDATGLEGTHADRQGAPVLRPPRLRAALHRRRARRAR